MALTCPLLPKRRAKEVFKPMNYSSWRHISTSVFRPSVRDLLHAKRIVVTEDTIIMGIVTDAVDQIDCLSQAVNGGN